MHIATRELKDHLSEYLRLAQAGEEITVTAHGKPIAKLMPADPPQAPTDPLARLAWLRPGAGARPKGLGAARVRPRGHAPLSDLVLEDR